jgi:hypothetical protein
MKKTTTTQRKEYFMKISLITNRTNSENMQIINKMLNNVNICVDYVV